jgi:predicted GNAT family acetyltransferase
MATQNPYSDSLLMDAFRGSLSNAESLGRGFAVAPVGLFGDMEGLLRKGVNYSFGRGGVNVNETPFLPTTESLLSNIPRVSQPRMETSGMEQLGAAMNPRGPVDLARGVVRVAGSAVNEAMVYGRGPLASITPQPMRMVNDAGGLLKPKYSFDVARRDASDLFGAGAERVMYKDPKSGAMMEVLAKPDGTASVLSLEVPEKFRGKGIGESLQAQVMQDFPEMTGQVSSKAAAKTAYRLGRRPPNEPNATLDDVYKLMDENSSVNLVSPQMQKRFMPEQAQDFVYPQEEAMLLAQQRAALPPEQGGLGLLSNNTAAERAAAQGGKEAIHFSRTGGDFNVLDSGQYAVAPFDAVGTHVGTKEAALDRFRNTSGTIDTPRGSTYPVQVLGDRPLMNEQGLPWSEDELNAYLRKTGGHNWSDVNGGKMTYQDMNKDLRKKLFEEQGYTSIPYVNDVEAKGAVSYIVPPDNLRSRFAAFDPFRKTAATAAAMGVAAPDLLAQEQPVITQQQIDDEMMKYGLIGR